MLACACTSRITLYFPDIHSQRRTGHRMVLVAARRLRSDDMASALKLFPHIKQG